jgi:hypothetical protein
MVTKLGGGLDKGNAAKGALRLTRRSLMIGAATLAAGASLARDALFDFDFWFEFEDNQRRDTVLLKCRQTPQVANGQAPNVTSVAIWPRRLFGHSAKFTIKRYTGKVPDEKPTPKPPVNRSWPLFELIVDNCSLPAGPDGKLVTFSLVFRLTRSKDGQTVIAGEFRPGWGKPAVIQLGGSAGLPIMSFILGRLDDARAKLSESIENSGPVYTGGVLFSSLIPEVRMNDQFLPQLFGKRVQVERDARIGFDIAMNLHIESITRTTAGRSIYILDLPLAFENLVVRREFADEEETKPIEIASPTGSNQESKARKQGRLFDDELKTWRPAIFKKTSKKEQKNPDITTGLYGALFGFKLERGRSNALLNFEVGNLQAEGNTPLMRIRATVDYAELLPKGQLPNGTRGEASALMAAQDRAREEIVAVLRHSGDPARTMSGARWRPSEKLVRSQNEKVFHKKPARTVLGELTFLSGANQNAEVEGPFPFRWFDIIRQRTLSGEVEMRFRFEPTAKETRISWQRSHLDVSGLPAGNATPGAPLEVPPITFETRDRTPDNRKLIKFSARLTLHAASVTAPERIDENKVLIPGEHTTRLDFQDADVSLFIPALPDSKPDLRANARVPFGPPFSGRVVDAVFDMDRATLRLFRAVDLLSLKYRFAGLALTVPWPPTEKKVATLAPPGGSSQAGPATPPKARAKEERQPDQMIAEGGNEETANAKDKKNLGPRLGSRATIQERRPLLIVDFPPQHVMEQSFFRQRPEPIKFPELKPPSGDAALKSYHDNFAILRAPKYWANVPSRKDGKKISDRIAARETLQKLGGSENDPKLKAFIEAFGAQTRRSGLPREQRLYVGPEFLDADAYAIGVEILSEEAKSSGDDVTSAPDVDLPSATIAALEIARKADKPLGDPANPVVPGCETLSMIHAKRVEAEKDKIDPEYHSFRIRFAEAVKDASGQPPSEADKSRLKNFGTYYGSGWFMDIQKVYGGFLTPKIKALVRSYRGGDQTEISEFAEARLSGPSRIAFHVNPEDYEEGRAGGGVPFTLEGLTNWASMDMAVMRRADNPIIMPERGAIPPRWARQRSKNLADYLAFHGITSADAATTRLDATLRREGWAKFEERKIAHHRFSYNSIEQRMGEVFAGVKDPPNEFVTSIELPARLHLSPSSEASWKTPSLSVRRDALAASSDRLASARSHNEDALMLYRELWTARLAETGRDGGVRAIWSPDFRPEALFGRSPVIENDIANKNKNDDIPAAPPRGPYRPWAIPRSTSQRSPPEELARLQREQFLRTSMNANDRDQIVLMTSVHGLPVLGARDLQGDLVRGSAQIEPPDGYRVRGLKTLSSEEVKQGKLEINRLDKRVDESAIYRPEPLSISELSLSAMGGSLDLNTDFVPPVSVKLPNDGNLFDALTIERWRHKAVLGRDILVEIVYKGFLFPTGHPASLVKITERGFESDGKDGSPVAILSERKFLRFRKPVKEFPALGQPNKGRRWPLTEMTLLTRQTPDLVDPELVDPGSTWESVCSGASGEKKVASNGRIPLSNSTGICFWPRVRAGDGGEYWFEMRVDKESAPVRLPMIFVDNAAANDPGTMHELVKHYNGVTDGKATTFNRSGPTRRLMRGDQPVRMAPETKTGDTTFDSNWWILGAEGLEGNENPKSGEINNADFNRTSFMLGQDQPPFYPFIQTARSRFTQIERFSGTGHGWRDVRYEIGYVRDGFPDEPNLAGKADPDKSEIYLKFVAPVDKDSDDRVNVDMDMGNNADRSGGVATPNMQFIGISRRLGPVGGTAKKFGDSAAVLQAAAAPPVHRVPVAAPPPPPQESTDLSDLKDELKKVNFDNILGDGKLLGIVTLSQVLKVAGSVLDDHPVLKETIDYGASQLKDGVESAREFLTTNILKPAQKLVVDITREWERFARRTVSVAGQSFGLDKAFPEIGKDLERLKNAVDTSLSGDTNETLFLKSLSEVHEAGKRLIRTVDRIGRDPMGAMSNEQLGAIKNIREEVARVTALINTLRDPQQIGQFGKFFIERLVENTPAAKALRRFVFELPIPHVKPNAAPTDPQRIAAGFADDALRNALLKMDEILKYGSLTPEELQKRLESFQSELKRQLDAEALARQAESGDVAKILSDAAKKVASSTIDVLSSPAARAAAKALGVDNVFLVPARLESLGEEVKSALDTKDPGKLLKNLREKFPALFKAVEEWANDLALRKIGVGSASTCTSIHSAVRETISSFLPDENSFNAIAGCLAGLSAQNPNCTAGNAAGLYSQVAIAYIGKIGALRNIVDAVYPPGNERLQLLNKLGELQDRTGTISTSIAVALSDVARTLKALREAFPQLQPGQSGAGCALPETVNIAHDARLVAVEARKALEALKPMPGLLVEVTTAIGNFLNALAVTQPFSDQVRTAMSEVVRGAAVLGRNCMLSFQLVSGRLQQGVVLPVPQDLYTALGDAANALQQGIAPQAAQQLRKESDRLQEIFKSGGPFEIQMNEITTQIAALKTIADQTAVPADLNGMKQQVKAAQDALSKLPSQAEAMFEIVANKLQRDALDTVLRLARALTMDGLTAAANVAAPMDWLVEPVKLVLQVLVGKETTDLGALDNIDKLLDQLTARLDGIAKDQGIFATLLKSLTDRLNTRKLFVIAPKGAGKEGKDLLKVEIENLKAARNYLVSSSPDIVSAITELVKFRDSDREPKPALEQLVERFGLIDESLLRHVVLDVLDLRKFRDELEQLIRELVPTKIRLAYDLGTEMKNVGDILIPAAGQRLTITMRAEIDFLEIAKNPKNIKAPQFSVRGDVGRFQIRLFGSFHAVSLHFRGFTFTSGTGQSSDFKVNFERVEVGKDAQFLKQLQDYMSPKGDGLFVKPLASDPGIEAGYGLSLGSFGVGYLSFSNVTLNASAELPFSKGAAARFKVSVGRPDAPFLISSTIFGGGGYLALIADPEGFVGLEGSFDFGGVFAFGFGPLNGTGQITVGVTFSARRGQSAQLGGVFMVRGQANIACFNIVASLVVRLRYAGNKMEGEATFTYSFSIGLGDIEFSVAVKNSQGTNLGSGESPGQKVSQWEAPGLLPRTMFAAASNVMNDADPAQLYTGTTTTKPAAFLRADVVSRRKNWKKFHEDYFDKLPNGADE